MAVFARGEEALYAGDQAAASQIGATARELEALAALDASLAPLAERLRNAQIMVEDVASDLGRLAGKLSASIPNGWRSWRNGCTSSGASPASTGAPSRPRSSGSRA